MHTGSITREEALRGLAEILEAEADANPDDVTPEARFVEDLEIDSLSMIAIVVAIQDRFQADIPDDAIEHIKTVGDLLTYLVKE